MVAPGACAFGPLAGGVNPDAAVRLASTRALAALTTGSEDATFAVAPIPRADPQAVTSPATTKQTPACLRDAMGTGLSFPGDEANSIGLLPGAVRLLGRCDRLPLIGSSPCQLKVDQSHGHSGRRWKRYVGTSHAVTLAVIGFSRRGFWPTTCCVDACPFDLVVPRRCLASG